MPRHGERAKNALLDAGAQLLIEAPIHKTLRSITAREVARRAGKTTGSFYNYWPTQDEFCADLVERVLTPDQVRLESDGPAPDLAGLLGALFDHHVAVDRFRLYLLLAGFANESHVAAALERRAAELNRTVEAALTRAFPDSAPEATHDLAVMLTALADGFGVRCIADPDDRRWRERFVTVAQAVVSCATAAPGDQRWSARQSVG